MQTSAQHTIYVCTYPVHRYQLLDDKVLDDELVAAGEDLRLEFGHLSQGDENRAQILILVVQMGNERLWKRENAK